MKSDRRNRFVHQLIIRIGNHETRVERETFKEIIELRDKVKTVSEVEKIPCSLDWNFYPKK